MYGSRFDLIVRLFMESVFYHNARITPNRCKGARIDGNHVEACLMKRNFLSWMTLLIASPDTSAVEDCILWQKFQFEGHPFCFLGFLP